MLTTDTETPVVTKTAVGPDLLETLEVVTHALVDGVGEDVGVLAVVDVLLSVEEPVGDLELGGVLHDGDDALELVRVELSGTAGVSGHGHSRANCVSRRRSVWEIDG